MEGYTVMSAKQLLTMCPPDSKELLVLCEVIAKACGPGVVPDTPLQTFLEYFSSKSEKDFVLYMHGRYPIMFPDDLLERIMGYVSFCPAGTNNIGIFAAVTKGTGIGKLMFQDLCKRRGIERSFIDATRQAALFWYRMGFRFYGTKNGRYSLQKASLTAELEHSLATYSCQEMRDWLVLPSASPKCQLHFRHQRIGRKLVDDFLSSAIDGGFFKMVYVSDWEHVKPFGILPEHNFTMSHTSHLDQIDQTDKLAKIDQIDQQREKRARDAPLAKHAVKRAKEAPPRFLVYQCNGCSVSDFSINLFFGTMGNVYCSACLSAPK